MLRRLDFDAGSEAYDLMQLATIQTQAQFPVAELIVLAAVQKKFEAIGTIRDGQEGAILKLRLCTGGSVILEDGEHAALKKAFDGVPWTAAVAQGVAKVKPLLDHAPEHVLAADAVVNGS